MAIRVDIIFALTGFSQFSRGAESVPWVAGGTMPGTSVPRPIAPPASATSPSTTTERLLRHCSINAIGHVHIVQALKDAAV